MASCTTSAGFDSRRQPAVEPDRRHADQAPVIPDQKRLAHGHRPAMRVHQLFRVRLVLAHGWIDPPSSLIFPNRGERDRTAGMSPVQLVRGVQPASPPTACSDHSRISLGDLEDLGHRPDADVATRQPLGLRGDQDDAGGVAGEDVRGVVERPADRDESIGSGPRATGGGAAGSRGSATSGYSSPGPGRPAWRSPRRGRRR